MVICQLGSEQEKKISDPAKIVEELGSADGDLSEKCYHRTLIALTALMPAQPLGLE